MNAATLAGGAAILLWSTLAWLAAGATRIPPLELLALSFGVASVLGLAYAAARRVNVFRAARRHPGALAAHHLPRSAATTSSTSSPSRTRPWWTRASWPTSGRSSSWSSPPPRAARA
jgi:hypothetical protein